MYEEPMGSRYICGVEAYRRMEYIRDISWGARPIERERTDASPARSVRRPEDSERGSGNSATKRNPPYGLATRSPRSDRRVTLRFAYLPFDAKLRSDEHSGCIRNPAINRANNAMNPCLIKPCPHPMSRGFLCCFPY